MRRFTSRILHFFSPNKQLLLQLEHLLGYTPKHLPYYQLALMHRSKIEELAHNNERLEFLGDAILGSIVAEYLFKNEHLLEETIQTALYDKSIRADDLEFHSAVREWASIIEYGDMEGYISHFNQVKEFFADRLMDGAKQSTRLIEKLSQ